MSVLDKLQSLPTSIKRKTVKTQKLGEVELIAPYASHRFEMLRASKEKSSRNFALSLIATCLADDGRRLIDNLDLDEVIQMLDPLGADDVGLKDIDLLFDEANRLAKILNADVEDAEKN